jgi:hypothetical protein
MTKQSFLKRDFYASQHQAAIFNQTVHIIADPYAHGCSSFA